jgi:hypothetical protein
VQVTKHTLIFLKSFKIEILHLDTNEKDLLHHFEHHDLRDAKELGSENWGQSRYSSYVEDLQVML